MCFESRIRDGRETMLQLESSQLPLFRLLGTPDKDKKHMIYDTGHGVLPRADEVRETLRA
jgi:hypothetical protein